MTSTRRLTTVSAASGGALLLIAGPALAYWTFSSTGEGTAAAGTLGKPFGTVSAVTTTSMTLTFTPPAGVRPADARYAATGTDGVGCSTSVGVSSCTVSGLTDGKAYTYSVVATLGAGSGGWTSPASDAFSQTTTAVARSFLVSPNTKSVAAGETFAVTLTAQNDAATDSTYTGTKAISWDGTYSRTGSTVPLSADFVNGTATVKLSLAAPGTGTLVVTEGARSGALTVTVAQASSNEAPRLTSVTGGNGNGIVGTGDTLVFTFSEGVSVASTTTTVTINRESESVHTLLTIPGVLDGSVTLPGGTGNASGWLSQPGGRRASFAATVNVSGGTLTVTLGAAAAGNDTLGTGRAGITSFVPAASIKDAEGAGAAGTHTTTSTYRPF